MALENVETGRSLEVVDNGCPFVSADGDTLRFAVKVDGRIAVRSLRISAEVAVSRCRIPF